MAFELAGGTVGFHEFLGNNWNNWTSRVGAAKGSDWYSAIASGLNGTGASGGIAGGDTGLNGVGYFAKAAMNGFDMWHANYAAKHQASAFKWQGRFSEKEQTRQGEQIAQGVGDIQRQGLDRAVLRYNALAREIGEQRSRGAGTGIDLSSDVVSRAEHSSRRAAAWDVGKIAEQTRQSANEQSLRAMSAFASAAYSRIQGDYQAKLARNRGTVGMLKSGWNMAVNAGKGIADIWSGGFVSAADSAMGGVKGGGGGLGMIA